MRRSRLSSFAAFAALLCFVAIPLGCVKAPDVDYTIPADGETGVDASTEIIVAFTQTLDPETATEVANFVVSGSVSGAKSTTAVLDETNRILTITVIDPFVSGETVTVALTSRITTSVSIALDEFQFSFAIAGVMASPGDFDAADGEFLVTGTDPTNGLTGLSQRPVVRASFDRPVLTSSVVETAILMRGSMSGTRSVSTSVAQVTGMGDLQTADVVLAQLAADEDIFEPGETVTVTFTSSLTAPPDEGTTENLTLRPYIASFEAQGGIVTGDFSEALPLNLQIDEGWTPAVQVLVADLLPSSSPEIIVLEQSGLIRVLSRFGDGPFGTFATLGGAPPIMIATGDLLNEGRNDLVVLRSDGTIEFQRLAGIQFVELDPRIEVQGTNPSDLVLADLDGDGFLDVTVAVGEGLEFYRKLPTTAGQSTGHLQLPGDPLVVPVSDIAAGDIDQDGRIDLVADTSAGISVLRNAGNFLFASVSTLATNAIPGTIRIADFNGDTLPDVVLGAEGGVFVHFNSGDGFPAMWTATTVPLGPGIAPTTIEVGNFDGDVMNVPDLVWYDPNATTPFGMLRGDARGLASSEVIPIPLAENAPLGMFATGDFDRDQGRDFLIAGAGVGGSSSYLISTSRNVVGGGESTFTYRLTAPRTATVGGGLLPVTISADLGDSVTGFSFAFDFDSVFSIESIVLEPLTFAGDVGNVIQIPSEDGMIIDVDLDGAQLPMGDGVPLMTIFFEVSNSATPAEYTFALVESLTGLSGETGASEVRLPSGGIGIPDLVFASVDVEFDSSVSRIEDLTCSIFNGEPELTWSIPSNQVYDAIQVSRGGAFIAGLGGTETSFIDTGATGGATYSVVGVLNGVSSLPQTCTPPEVFGSLTCQRLNEDLERVRLDWNSPGNYDTITIRRDGQVIAVRSGNVDSYVDDTGDLDGHFYEVFGTDATGEDSTIATCPQGEIDDVGDAALTLSPVGGVTLAIEQGNVDLTWVNGESYETITVRRNGADVADLSGATSSFEETVNPGVYTYSVRGSGDGLLGVFVDSNTVQTGAPAPTDVTCAPAGGNQVEITWTNAFEYDAIRIERAGTDGIQLLIPAVGATSFVDTGVIDGTYNYTVIGVVGGIDSPSEPCTIELLNLIRVDDIVTTPGQIAKFAVKGQLLESIESFTMTLSYPVNQLQPLAIEVPGLAPEDFELSPPTVVGSIGTVTVTVPGDGSVLLPAGLDRTFFEVDFIAAIDLAAIGSGTVDITAASLEPVGGGDPITPTIQAGALEVVDFGLYFDPVTVTPGGVIEGWVWGSFSAELAAYQLAITYDPTVLAIEEITSEGTIADLTPGFFLPRIEPAEGLAALVGLPSGGSYPPQALAPLAYLRIQVLPFADPTTTLLEFQAWISDDDQLFENLYLRPEPLPGETGIEIVPMVFPGIISVVTSTDPPTISRIEPTTGPVEGGAMVSISGTNFSGTPEVRFGGELAEVELISDTLIFATTPAGTPGPVDVSVTTVNGTATLADAYNYESIELSGVVPALANACAPQAVLIEGEGFTANLSVAFGQANGTVLQVQSDGRSALVVPPTQNEAAPGGESIVDLTLTDLGSGEVLILPQSFTYETTFIRGDLNGDGTVDNDDVEYLSAAIAGSGPLPAQLDAADVNDDGTVHVGDLVYLHAYVHSGGPAPLAPFPLAGSDLTPDGLPGCN